MNPLRCIPHRRFAGVVCLLIGIFAPAVGQVPAGKPFANGQVMDAVPCLGDPAQSYALYLPPSYAPNKSWPIIYFFDPGAEGGRPVALYKDIAEKYGFILAGSNNSRNFGGDSPRSMTAMWQDTHSRFALDEHRTYTSGFSGGARVAGSMALGCRQCQIAGVIAQGAGYPGNYRAESRDPLLYFFTVGDRDFNWPEVITVRREREDAGLAYRVEVFSGDHQWAPPEVMEKAVEWMTLKGMQTGSQSRDTAFIDRLWLRAQQQAVDAEKGEDAIARLKVYRSLVSDFKDLKNGSVYEDKLAVLKKSAELKSALKKEKIQIADQASLESEISPKLEALAAGSAEDPTLLQRDITQGMSRLKDQSARGKAEERRLVAARALSALWVQGIEAGQMQLESRHFATAEACFQVMSEVNDNPWPVLLLAETRTAQGNRKQAIKDLREAIRRGLKDPQRLENDGKLQSLKSEPEFQKIVEELRNSR